MSHKPYPAYKPSGSGWLGEIPAHWDILRFKFLISEPLKYGANEVAELDDPILPRYVRITDVNEDGTLRDDTFKSLREDAAYTYLLKDGDLLFARSGATVGKTFLYQESWGRAAYAGYLIRGRIALGKMLPQFAAYFARSTNYWNWIFSSIIQATIQNVSAEKYNNLVLSVPPLDEQSKIVVCLDRETARIDRLIEKKERQIELLQEKRTALISHAVTRGLNPNAPMKDSGIEWLGEIPAHWEVVRVKSLEGNSSSVVQTGPFGAQLHAKDYLDDGVPLILIRNVKEMRINDTNIPRVSPEDADRLSAYRLKKGDIIFSRVGSIGRIALCTEREQDWLISGQMLRIRIINPRLNDEFAAYAIGCSAILTFIELQSVGSTRESINTDILRNLPLPIPSFNEQRAIAAFLDRETARIDALIMKIKESIDKLREYRTAMISAAVTGKIKVNDEWGVMSDE